MLTTATVLTPKSAVCAYLQVALPGFPVQNAGVLVLDPETDELHFKLRRDWDAIAPEEAEVLDLLSDQIGKLAGEMGGTAFLKYAEQILSNILLISERENIIAANLPARMERLYRENVEPRVLQYRTHLPLTTLRAAAGHLSEEQTVSGAAEDWIEVPPNVRLREGMFVARVTGRSMEPLIPENSLCVFDGNAVAGSRAHRRLLIQKLSSFDETSQFTVKEYSSVKRVQTDGSWEHRTIRLKPLNPDYEPWDLTPDEFRVLGEFVAVLPEAE
jgi:SOS-response transcriptional repressor LexA